MCVGRVSAYLFHFRNTGFFPFPSGRKKEKDCKLLMMWYNEIEI